MSPPEKRFISSTNIGGREEDELRPRIESEYTTEKQAIRKMMVDYYSDKPFKDVNRFPAQILKVLSEADFKKDNYVNNFINVTITPTLLEKAKEKAKLFLGFNKRYKARVLDLDLAIPAATNEGSKDINALTHIPKDKTELEIVKNNILIDHIYTTEFIPKDSSIVCNVGDIVIVSFDNNSNRTFGIIEKVLANGDQINKPAAGGTPEAPSNPSAPFQNTPPPAPSPPLSTDESVTIDYFADSQNLVPIVIPEEIRPKRGNLKHETVWNDSQANKVLNTLDPRFKQKVIQFINNARKSGYNVTITDGYRSIQTQKGLYSKGRFGSTESIVTNAIPGSSPHNFGMAIDFYVLDKNYLLNFNYTNDMTKTHTEAAQVGKKIGLEWGGDWTSPYDPPHLEMKGWRAIHSRWKSTFNYDSNNIDGMPDYKVPKATNEPPPASQPPPASTSPTPAPPPVPAAQTNQPSTQPPLENPLTR